MRLVRELLDAWETARAEQRMQLAVLQGPTGIGKTAVLQALYEQVAMRQPRPAYWPPRIDSLPTATATDQDRTAGVVVGRAARQGLVFPERVAPAPAVERRAVVEGDGDEFVYQQPGAVASLFWWGLTAHPGGAPLLEGDAQLKAHVEAIAQAVVQGDRLRIDRLRLALKSVFLVANLGLLGETIGPLLDAVDNGSAPTPPNREGPTQSRIVDLRHRIWTRRSRRGGSSTASVRRWSSNSPAPGCWT